MQHWIVTAAVVVAVVGGALAVHDQVTSGSDRLLLSKSITSISPTAREMALGATSAPLRASPNTAESTAAAAVSRFLAQQKILEEERLAADGKKADAQAGHLNTAKTDDLAKRRAIIDQLQRELAQARISSDLQTNLTGSGQKATVAPPPLSQQVNVHYNAPQEIPYGQATEYRVVISKPASSTVGDFEGTTGPVLMHRIPDAPQMKATLSGPQALVSVESQGGAQCQPITADSNATWSWAVTPKTTEPFKLQVYISEVDSRCDNAAAKSHRIDSFAIKVHATFWQNIQIAAQSTYNVVAAIIALITALGGAWAAWVKFFKKRKKPVKKPAETHA